MTTRASRKAILIGSILLALALTTTSIAQVTIVNSYSVTAHPMVSPVSFSRGINNTSQTNVNIADSGTHAYLNTTQYLQLNGQNSANISNLFALVSTTGSSFGYATNVTLFSGQKTTEIVSLYSISDNGTYTQDYNYTASSSYSNNTSPVYINPHGKSTFGLYLQLGKSGFAGPYTWNLNFEIDGFFGGNGNSPAVYTQYFVNMRITTFEVS